MKKRSNRMWVVMLMGVLSAGSAFGGMIGSVFTVPVDRDVTDGAVSEHDLSWNSFSDAFYTSNITQRGTAGTNQYVMPGTPYVDAAATGWLVYAFQASPGQKITEFRDYITQTYIKGDSYIESYWTASYDGLADPVAANWNYLAKTTSGTFYPDAEKVYLAYKLVRNATAANTYWYCQLKGDATRISTANIPEPATISLMVVGGIAAVIRRRQ